MTRAREVGYDKEISSRNSLAGVFPNVIYGVAKNWHERA